MDEDSIARGGAGTLQIRKTRGEKSWRSARNQAAFLLHLTATGNVSRSAAAAGLSLPGGYLLRQRDLRFRERWHHALCEGHVRLHALVLEGAEVQATVPRDDEGEIDRIAMKAYDPKVALALLKMHGPTVRGEALGRGQPRPRSADELRVMLRARLAEVVIVADAASKQTDDADDPA